MAKYFLFPFAENGDKQAVPDDETGTGDVSYEEGYSADYGLEQPNPNAKDIERLEYNQVQNDITENTKLWQTFGVFPHITTAVNGGSPFIYKKFARVEGTDNNVYESKINSNTDVPPSANWQIVDISALVQSIDNKILEVKKTYFITPGNFTHVPDANTRSITFECQGGGGGSGNIVGVATGRGFGGAGGGGGYAVSSTSGTIGSSYAVTVGAGGAGGGTSSVVQNGSNGGDTIVSGTGISVTGEGGTFGSGNIPTTGTNVGTSGTGGFGTGDFIITGSAGVDGVVVSGVQVNASLGGGCFMTHGPSNPQSMLVSGNGKGGDKGCGSTGPVNIDSDTDRQGSMGGGGVVIVTEYIQG